MSALARLIERARALVFDFDGTLVESNAIKYRAFERCFADVPAGRRAAILAYCRSSHHTPRWEKFRYVYERLLRRPYPPEVESDLLRRFEEETTRQIMRAPEIAGASRFLAQAVRTHETALLSSTPQEILLEILKGRGWRGYFHAVQGAPVHKADWLSRSRMAHGGEKEDVVFFGDTVEDAHAAEAAGCAFVAIGKAALRRNAHGAAEDFTALVSAVAKPRAAVSR